jgi:hypothetical protein
MQSKKIFIDLIRLNELLNPNIDPNFLKTLPVEQRNINLAFRHLEPGLLEVLKQKSVPTPIWQKLTNAEKNIHTGYKNQHITPDPKELTPQIITLKRTALVIDIEKARKILQKTIDKDFFQSLTETEKRMHRKFISISDQNPTWLARLMDTKSFEPPE